MPAAFHLVQNLGFDLQIPGVVDLSGLQHSAGRRSSVAATLKDHTVEVGRLAPPVRVAYESRHVVDLEIFKHVRAGAVGIQVLLAACLRRGADAIGKLGLLQDAAGVVGHKGQVWIGMSVRRR